MNKDLYDGLIIKPSLDELYHHGVKGQRKGVRHGPPYPLSRQKKGNGRLVSGKGSVQKQKKKPRKVWSYAMLEKDLKTGRRELTKEEYDKYTMFVYDQYAKTLPWLNDYVNDNDPDLERFDPLHPQESIQKYRDDLNKKSEESPKKTSKMWNEMTKEEQDALVKKELAEENAYYKKLDEYYKEKYPPGSNLVYSKKKKGK